VSAKSIKIKKQRTLVVGQWIEVEVVEGVTKTTRHPDDQAMFKVISDTEKRKGRPGELVYRRLNIVNGVPPEYVWTTHEANDLRYGGVCVQRLRVDDWFTQMMSEKGGHVRYCEFYMPRAESRGGCDCQACRRAAERIRLHGR
jgi:hypothetical protein